LMIYSECKSLFISSEGSPHNQKIELTLSIPKGPHKRLRIYFEIIFIEGFDQEIYLTIENNAPVILKIDPLTQKTLDFCNKGKNDYVMSYSVEIDHEGEQLMVSARDSPKETPSGFWGLTNFLIDIFEECQSNAETQDDKTCVCNEGFYPLAIESCERRLSFSGTLCFVCKPCPRNMISCRGLEDPVTCSKGLTLSKGKCLAQQGKKNVRLNALMSSKNEIIAKKNEIIAENVKGYFRR
jgi:hypothetical protein